MTTTETTNIFDMETIVEPYEESNDPNRKTHIVNPPNNTHIWQPGMTAKDVVDIARSQGLEVTALCGYKWVPKHNPEAFDSCDRCLEIASELLGGFNA